MNKIDLISISLKNLAKRKIRTALTILSVIIGASSIIVMVSLGVALDEKFNKEIESISNITQITLSGYNDKILKEDLPKLNAIPNVTAVTPSIEVYDLKVVVSGRYVGTFTAVGIAPETMEQFGYIVEDGRILDETDIGKNSIVFGGKCIYSFYKKGKAEPYYKYVNDTEEADWIEVDVLNSRVQIHTDSNYGLASQYINNTSENTNHKSFNADIVGVLSTNDDYLTDHRIYMPYESLEKLQKDILKANGINQQNTTNGYEEVLIKCDSFNNVEKVVSEIESYFEQTNRDIQIYTDAEYIQSSKKMTNMIQALLGAIGSISLFISAIGIANTMIMAIYERTKEIGIMKVIGAKVSDIKKLFLLEATLIGFIGGFIGVLFSYLISFSLNHFGGAVLSNILVGGFEKISSIPLWLASSSLIFSSLIGLFSGYLPAMKVVKIEALKAIKSE